MRPSGRPDTTHTIHITLSHTTIMRWCDDTPSGMAHTQLFPPLGHCHGIAIVWSEFLSSISYPKWTQHYFGIKMHVFKECPWQVFEFSQVSKPTKQCNVLYTLYQYQICGLMFMLHHTIILPHCYTINVCIVKWFSTLSSHTAPRPRRVL